MFFKINLYFYLLSVFLLSNVYSIEPDTLWTNTYGGMYKDQGLNILQTKDNGYLWTGLMTASENNSEDVCLVKIDSLGSILWEKTYGGYLTDKGVILLNSHSNGYLIVGYSQSFGMGGSDVWIIKTNSFGDTLWTKTYGGAEDDFIFSAQRSGDEYILAGFTHSFGYGKGDVWVIKIDSIGNVIWDKTFGGAQNDEARSISTTFDGGYIVTGYTKSIDIGNRDIWLLKLNKSGDTLWTKTYGGIDLESGITVVQTKDNGYLIEGYTESFGNGGRDLWLIKTNENGDMIWSKTYGGYADDYGHKMEKTKDNGFLITGFTESSGNGGKDFWIIKIDSTGKELWNKTLGGSYDDYGQYAHQCQDGSFIAIGITNSFGNGDEDAWIIKLSNDEISFTDAPIIAGITDVPQDQGGWVNINFYRSIYDTDTLISQEGLSKIQSLCFYTVELNDRNGWIAATSLGAYGKSQYSALVHTTKDSSSEDNGLIEFRVIVSVDEGNYASDIQMGYSVDNLVPEIPQGLKAIVLDNKTIKLSWQPSIDADFCYFNIYRIENDDLYPVNSNPYFQTIDTTFIDEQIELDQAYYYYITALDFSGNESYYSEKVFIEITNINSKHFEKPSEFRLDQNFPNPFNPTTKITYRIPKRIHVRLIIYDLLGNEIIALVDKLQDIGRYDVNWNGLDKHGKKVGSGFYIFKLQASDYNVAKKMLLIK